MTAELKGWHVPEKHPLEDSDSRWFWGEAIADDKGPIAVLWEGRGYTHTEAEMEAVEKLILAAPLLLEALEELLEVPLELETAVSYLEDDPRWSQDWYVRMQAWFDEARAAIAAARA